MNNLNYPLHFLFKIFTPSNDFTVTDNGGQEIAYTRQKIFRIKEAVEVYGNSRREQVRYTLKADRIIDFNAVYTLRDAAGQTIGKLKREGMRSLWRTSYTLLDAALPAQRFTVSLHWSSRYESDPMLRWARALILELFRPAR